jgi:hypothetical protein
MNENLHESNVLASLFLQKSRKAEKIRRVNHPATCDKGHGRNWQGCQIDIRAKKSQFLGIKWRALQWKIFVYFTTIWYVLWAAGIFCDNFEYFVVFLVYFSQFRYVAPRKIWQPCNGHGETGRVARRYIFVVENPSLGKFWTALEWTMFAHFWPFRIFSWPKFGYIVWPFGTIRCHLVYFSILACCT